MSGRSVRTERPAGVITYIYMLTNKYILSTKTFVVHFPSPSKEKTHKTQRHNDTTHHLSHRSMLASMISFRYRVLIFTSDRSWSYRHRIMVSSEGVKQSIVPPNKARLLQHLLSIFRCRKFIPGVLKVRSFKWFGSFFWNLYNVPLYGVPRKVVMVLSLHMVGYRMDIRK